MPNSILSSRNQKALDEIVESIKRYQDNADTGKIEINFNSGLILTINTFQCRTIKENKEYLKRSK